MRTGPTEGRRHSATSHRPSTPGKPEPRAGQSAANAAHLLVRVSDGGRAPGVPLLCSPVECRPAPNAAQPMSRVFVEAGAMPGHRSSLGAPVDARAVAFSQAGAGSGQRRAAPAGTAGRERAARVPWRDTASLNAAHGRVTSSGAGSRVALRSTVDPPPSAPSTAPSHPIGNASPPWAASTRPADGCRRAAQPPWPRRSRSRARTRRRRPWVGSVGRWCAPCRRGGGYRSPRGAMSVHSPVDSVVDAAHGGDPGSGRRPDDPRA